MSLCYTVAQRGGLGSRGGNGGRMSGAGRSLRLCEQQGKGRQSNNPDVNPHTYCLPLQDGDVKVHVKQSLLCIYCYSDFPVSKILFIVISGEMFCPAFFVDCKSNAKCMLQRSIPGH